MAELLGMTGKIARVDLSTGTVTVIEPEEEVYRKFLGGSAMGAYYLFKEGIFDPKLDPLGPDNLLQFMIGPVTGASPNARITLVTKSAYNIFCASTCGGHFGSELKFAGWDGIQIVGKASKPVYLAVIDDKIEIRDAGHVWGKDVEESEMILKSEVLAELESREGMLRDADLNPEWAAMRPPKRLGLHAKRLAHVMTIGQGGENQVWYSCVVTEGARAAGRWGAGAVMGSKNLKAVVVRGTKGHKLADKKTFLSLVSGIQKSERGDYFWRSYGTAGIGANSAYVEDAFPIRNWQWCSWADPHVKAITGPFMDQTSFVRKTSCYGCNLHCLYPVEVTSTDPLLDRTMSDMPDWEAMGMVGGNLGYMELEGTDPGQPYKGTVRDQAESLAKLQYTTFIHDNYSLDFIEGGNNLALVMELVQRGFIDKTDLDGIDLKWGDVHAVDEMVKKIVTRDGIGDKLAQGTYETARYFAELKGKPEIMNYSMTAHHYGQPAHDVRSPADKNAMEYVTVNRACAHTGGGTGGFKTGDWAAAIAGQNVNAAQNSLVHCQFPAGHWAGSRVDLIKAATGWSDFSDEDLQLVGAREYALSRIFEIHIRQLKDPKAEWDRQVPPRWFNDPLPTGSQKGAVAYEGKPDVLFNEALPAYWKERGWTEDKGIPTQETLKKLGIDDVAGDVAAQHL
ncbi:MAG: aldehyde ferredoxin oxidoreductase C-terminal domain-containing protein [Anaerolineaceae bacterium]|jgi:aldehyde:ferredoxin oxidoreductase|nr:aldehyde ferredoxin oxidoreductase C-terminal domain-containing protein [Anaerolineaceae bacterium]